MDTTQLASNPSTWPGLTTPAHSALLSRYELLHEVGRGGMGVVYRARHRTLDRLVALKVMLPGASPDRFLREARLLAQIRSSHVVAVHDCELLPDGFPLLIMEWIEGENLQQLLDRRREPLSEEEVRRWMLHCCEGMQAAADLGIIHRDFKPSNVLVDAQGNAHVADFGLARETRGQPELTLHGGGMMGTPYYMAPEQAEDPHGVDTRADIYSFGAAFYHLLTGVTPFEGPSAFTILFRHKTEPLIPPRTRAPHLSAHISEVLERCLAKAPSERFQSFKEVRRQLEGGPGKLSPWYASEDVDLAPYLARYEGRREVYLHRREELTHPDVYEFPGGRVLRILAGSLAEQHVDALVSSEDGHLTMGEEVPNPRGVAAALRLAAGPGYVEEARRFVPVRPGRVVVTPAGQLPARFVFHGITLEGNVEQRVCPSRDLIADILASCFYHADTLYVRTIAFPLLGTGAGGFAPEVCLDTMVRFLARLLLRGLTSVQEVRLVLYSPPLSSSEPATA